MNSGQMLSSLAYSSLKVHCSYRLRFFVAKNHPSSSLSNCSLLGSRFARVHRGCGTAHAQMHCRPETKSKMRPIKKYALAGTLFM